MMKLNASFWAPLLIIAITITGFLAVTGHITDGPELTDDNQIYKLQIELEEDGFVRVLVDELRVRYAMRRLVPTYCVQKIVQARIFGGNLVAWSVYTGLLAAFAAGVLFHFFRLCHGKVLASLAFAMITVVGEQSVVWWRMLHGEGIGLLLLSIALVLMIQHIRTRKLPYEITFLLFTTSATLAKESFILVIPAVLFLKIWITAREQETTLRVAARRNWLSAIWLTVLFATELLIIRVAFATTSFNYAGWKGFDADQLQNMVQQYLQITNALLLAALLVVAWLLWIFRPKAVAKVPSGGRKRVSKHALDPSWTQRTWASLAMAIVFCLLMTVPQLLLYKSTGMLNTNSAHFGRYVIPGILGYAFLVAEIIRLIQLTSNNNRVIVALVAVMLAVSISDKSITAYREAAEFSEQSRVTDNWFQAIANSTERESPIVIVFMNGLPESYSLQIALRVYYILGRCYDRENVYYSPILQEPTLEEASKHLWRADTRRHAKSMRPVGQMDPSRPPAAIMILDLGPPLKRNQPISLTLDRWLQTNRQEWFELDEYRRKVHPNGHVTYFRKEQ